MRSASLLPKVSADECGTGSKTALNIKQSVPRSTDYFRWFVVAVSLPWFLNLVFVFNKFV